MPNGNTKRGICASILAVYVLAPLVTSVVFALSHAFVVLLCYAVFMAGVIGKTLFVSEKYLSHRNTVIMSLMLFVFYVIMLLLWIMLYGIIQYEGSFFLSLAGTYGYSAIASLVYLQLPYAKTGQKLLEYIVLCFKMRRLVQDDAADAVLPGAPHGKP